jgi:hypothetical protein
MSWFKSMLFILIALGSVCSSCCTFVAKTEIDPQIKENMKKSSIANDVELEISLPGSVVVGDPVEMVLRLTNQGIQMRYWTHTNGVYELGINVDDAKNSAAALTILGQQEGAGPFNPFSYLNVASRVGSELPPGDSHEWRIDLSKYFVLAPGSYTVSATMLLGQDQSLPIGVKNVKFTVTAK